MSIEEAEKRIVTYAALQQRIEELEREVSKYKKGFITAAMRLKKLGKDPKELLELIKHY